MNLITRLYHLIVGEPQVARAIASVNKAVKRLEDAVTWQNLKKEVSAEAARLAAEAEKVAAAEAEKARRLADKMIEFFELNQ